MRPPLVAPLLLLVAASPIAAAEQTAYDFACKAIEDDSPLPLSRFAGKTLLIVNTASRCGLTYQYEALQALWERYRDRGLVVIGVPSNDFGGQEPGRESEIKTFCETTFGIDFPMTSKVDVIGKEAHPLYRWAVRALGPEAAPRWNFHKYLIAPDGHLVTWFPSRTEPDAPELTRAIEDNLPHT
jgi:glutathione peroxidase